MLSCESARSTARRLLSRSVPMTTRAETPASRARSRAAWRSPSNWGSWRWQWESTSTPHLPQPSGTSEPENLQTQQAGLLVRWFDGLPSYPQPRLFLFDDGGFQLAEQ